MKRSYFLVVFVSFRGFFHQATEITQSYHTGNKCISRIAGSSNRWDWKRRLKKGQEPGQPQNSIRAMNEHQQSLHFSIFVILHSRFKIPGKKPKFLYELLFYPCLDEGRQEKYMIHSRKVLNSTLDPLKPSLVNAAEDALSRGIFQRTLLIMLDLH